MFRRRYASYVTRVQPGRERSAITTFPDYVRRIRNEKNLSLAEAAARSQGQIGKTHINRIENGTLTRVSLLKLRALARGLDVPEDELIGIAQGKAPVIGAPANEGNLLNCFRQLSLDRQEDVLVMLHVLAKCSGEWHKPLAGAAVK